MSEAVLLVDDEPEVLAACQRFLGRRDHVEVASHGEEALAALEQRGPFSALVSDLEMPNMDGIALLARARTAYPDVVRVLLTGNTDIHRAIEVVNHGGVFRFLIKPCKPADFVATVEAAVAQHRLLSAERDVLEKTLRGSVQMLAEVFALAEPDEFGRAVRVQRIARDLAAEVGLSMGWEMEIASVLSRLGSIVVPEPTTRALRQGVPLTTEERNKIEGIPGVAVTLLRHVPRLEPVIALLAHLGTPFDATLTGSRSGEKPAPLGARVLKLAYDYDALLSMSPPRSTPDEVIQRMRARHGWYEPNLLDGLARVVAPQQTGDTRLVSLSSLTVGMVLSEDLLSDSGLLLLRGGVAVTEPMRLRLAALCARGACPSTIRVLAPASAAP